MSEASLVPILDQDRTVHLVLCDFGSLGLAYRETAPADADLETIINRMMRANTIGL